MDQVNKDQTIRILNSEKYQDKEASESNIGCNRLIAISIDDCVPHLLASKKPEGQIILLLTSVYEKRKQKKQPFPVRLIQNQMKQ